MNTKPDIGNAIIPCYAQLTLFGDGPKPGDSADRVYAMHRLGCVKIGHSTRPIPRSREIGASLLAMTPGDRDLEERIHWRFRQYRFCHEFFVPAPPVLAWVASLSIQVRPWPFEEGGLPLLHLAA